MQLPARLPSRVRIENVSPQVDGGRFPIKRCVGESITVAADVLCDSHEVLTVVLRYRQVGSTQWSEAPMTLVGNDRWSGIFDIAATTPCHYEYTVQAWIDRFGTWARDLTRRVEAKVAIDSELLEGAAMIRETAAAAGHDASWLALQADAINKGTSVADRVQAAQHPILRQLMLQNADRSSGTEFEPCLQVIVERAKAGAGAWYELFPRSAGPHHTHGTLRDVEKRLDYVARMGFDVLYLPPIHPIGVSYRKGPNNTLNPGPEDPGSPWAIGAVEGGHVDIHPSLGTLDDFRKLLSSAAERNIEIAMDLAYQCSPDHPWVKQHPEWFRHRPDGSIKYAENPPKKYQDIYPIDFECAEWRSLWSALLDVVLYWMAQGVRIFRVDNPHTKPFGFWEWMINEARQHEPDVIFLSEAFTRPKVMKQLAKAGFSQSYTYFTWRNTKRELIEYFTELTQTDVREYMRPNLFANTPDILPEYLQYGGAAAFRTRLVLAATLGATYGIYGPSFENFEATPVKPHSEEYLDSEKYQVRAWEWERPNAFTEFIGRINEIRRENPALLRNDTLRFYEIDNDHLICYAKSDLQRNDVILCIVNLDPHHTQSGWLRLPLQDFQIQPRETYQVHDLLTDARFLWQGEANYVELDPRISTSHVLKLRKRVRTEHDFDYYF